MLFVLLSSLIGLSSAGSDPDTSNYFIDAYEGGLTYYAYPMDICMKTGVLDFEYVTYECSQDSTTVTKTIYDDEDCMTITSVNGTIEFTEDDIDETGIFDFNCGGQTNYVVLDVFVALNEAAECNNPLSTSTTYSAVNVCHYSGSTGSNYNQLYTTCNATDASVSTYVNQTNCTFVDPTTVLTAKDECSYFTDAEVASLSAIFPVFSNMTSCVIEGVRLVPPAPEPESVAFTMQLSTSTIIFVSTMAIMKIFV